MKKSLLTSVVIITAFLALVYSQSATPSFTVEFKSPGVKPLELKTENLLADVNAIGLEGISADENVAAGLYEVAYAFEFLEPLLEHVSSLEEALGVRVAVEPRTKVTFGQQWFWNEPHRQLSNEDPILRRYLQRHAKTLDQLSPILDRPLYANYYYSPSSENEQLLINALVPVASTCRKYSRALRTRARVALAEGRIGDAIDDVNKIHRLGRHLLHDCGSMVEAYVGIAICGVATDAWLEILSNPAMTMDDLLAISDAINSAPPVSGIKALDVFERLMALQVAEGLERNGVATAGRAFSHHEWTQTDDTIIPTLGMLFTDWPEVYRAINRHFDEQTEVLLIADEAKRRAAIKALDSEANTFGFQNKNSIGLSLANRSAWYLIDELFLSHTAQYMRRLELARLENEVLDLCLALKRFNLEHQRYPDSLDELIGEYLDRIPVDFGTGVAVGYVPLEAGCVVYTSGRNEEDNRGWGYRNLTTSYGTYYDDVTYVIGKDDRPAPEGLEKPLPMISGRIIGGDREGWDRTRLSLAGEQVTLSEFETVCNIAKLKWLDLSRSNLPDNWHYALPRLQNLEVLSLVGQEVTEEIITDIAKLPSLQTLILNGTTIDGALGPIAAHPKLETLLLARSSVTENDLLVLETLPNLRKLNLSETQVSDAVGPVFAGLPELTHLQLSGTQITDQTLRHISKITELEVLRVDFTEITNAGVASLKNARLHTLGLIGTGVNNEISDVLAGKDSLRSVFLYETEFNIDIQHAGPPVALFDRPSDDIAGDQFEPSDLEYQQTNWGELIGLRGCYEITQDDNPLRLRLTSREAEFGYNNDPTKSGTGLSVLNYVKGDFEVSVKITPDWELHDEIMVNEKIGTGGWKGGPYLGAGLLIKQTEGHYFKWSWNSIEARSTEVYSNITPEYFIYPKVRKGPLEDFAFDFHEVEGSKKVELGFPAQYAAGTLSIPSTFNQDRLLAYPDLAVQGPLKHFDHVSIWLRLKRQGNTITAFSSEDGKSWAMTSELKTHFVDEVQVGLWCGKLSKSDYEFHFEDFTIKQ